MTLIIGHRGAPRGAPADTLSAVRRAPELEVDWVAFDLQATHAGEAGLLQASPRERPTEG